MSTLHWVAAPLPEILHELKRRLGAESAHIEVKFPYYILRTAFIADSNEVTDDILLRVAVPVTPLCRCSGESSDYGAHDHRDYLTLAVRPQKIEGLWELICIEELVSVAARSASVPVYPIFKRTDKRHVAMQAYDNPIYVEDVDRNAAGFLILPC
jgi:GTP cyclohydrolase IB